MTRGLDIKAIARDAFWDAYVTGNGAAKADLFKAVDAAIDAVEAARAPGAAAAAGGARERGAIPRNPNTERSGTDG